MGLSRRISLESSESMLGPQLSGEHASRFRIVAYVVQAAKRFKNSLNPKITFGKRNSGGYPAAEQRALSDGALLRQGTGVHRTVSGKLKKVGSRRLSAYLLQPLPEVKSN